MEKFVSVKCFERVFLSPLLFRWQGCRNSLADTLAFPHRVFCGFSYGRIEFFKDSQPLERVFGILRFEVSGVPESRDFRISDPMGDRMDDLRSGGVFMADFECAVELLVGKLFREGFRKRFPVFGERSFVHRAKTPEFHEFRERYRTRSYQLGSRPSIDRRQDISLLKVPEPPEQIEAGFEKRGLVPKLEGFVRKCGNFRFGRIGAAKPADCPIRLSLGYSRHRQRIGRDSAFRIVLGIEIENSGDGEQ
jgi:hypothetical protein